MIWSDKKINIDAKYDGIMKYTNFSPDFIMAGKN